MVDTNLLKSKMIAHGDNSSKLADALGIAKVTLSRKLNNIADFTNRETAFIVNRYNLTPNETINIFGLNKNECS